MAEERKANLQFGVDASEVRPGLEAIEVQVDGMAKRVGKSGREAGKGIAAIGDGGAQAVAKVDSATRSIVNSILRTTAAQKTGEKGTADYYEALAGARGINTDILRPYLEQLRQVEAAQKKTSASLQGVGVSAGQTTAALRQLPAQITDIVTSLQGGQKPLTVLIQQGGQIKDAFGGIGETFKALGGQVALLFPTFAGALGSVALQQKAVAEGADAAAEGITDIASSANDAADAARNAGAALGGVRTAAADASLSFLAIIGGFVAVAAAVATVVVAYRQGIKESDGFDLALLKTGNILGTTTGQLREMAQAIGSAGSYTEGAAAQALTAIASGGKVASGSLKEFTQVALEMRDYVGQSVEDTAKIFAELGNAPTKAVLKLNESLHFLTMAQLEQIMSLEEHGDKTRAAQLAQEAYAASVRPTIDAYKGNLDALDVALRYWTDRGKAMWDALAGKGRQETGEQRIAALKQQLAGLNSAKPLQGVGLMDAIKGAFDPSGTTARLKAATQAQIDYLERVTQAAKDNAKNEAARQRTQEAGVSAIVAVAAAQEKGVPKVQQMNKALEDYRKNIAAIRAANPESALLDAKKIEAGEKAIREQFAEKKGAGSGAAAAKAAASAYASLVSAIQQKIEAEKLEAAGVESLTGAQRMRIKYQEDLKGSLKTTSAAQRSFIESQLDTLEAQERLNEANKELVKSQKQVEAARDKEAQDAAKTILSLNEKARALEDEVSAYGMGAAAVAEMAIARLQLNKADIAGFDNSADRVAQIDDEIAALLRLGTAKDALEALKVSAKTDETLRAAEALNAQYAEEGQLVLLSSQERAKIVTQRKIELDYAKKIADITQTGLSAEQKQVEIAKLRAAEQLEVSAAINKATQEDWEATVKQYDDIFRQGFADMLNKGEEGWKSFTKSLKTTFKTAVADQIYKTFAKPFVVKMVASILGITGGAAGGLAQAATGGGAAQNVSNLSSLAGAGAQALWGGSVGASAASLAGANVVGAVGGDALGALIAGNGAWAGVAVEAGAAAASAGTAAASAASAASSLGSMAAAAGPWIAAAVALYGIIKSFDNSGTLHTGAGAIYSADKGLQGGASLYGQAAFGMGDSREYNAAAQANADSIARSIGTALDSVAVSFGQKAGYEIATAFADDSSKDGAWGQLRISKDGKDLLNWEDTRKSKWAPKEFGDGEEGYKQYLAAVAKDTRQVLLDMDLPSWADTMLAAVGEAADMDALAGVIAQIGQIQTAFVQLGKTVDGFAGMSDSAFEALLKASGGIETLAQTTGAYYENFYTEAERMGKATASLTAELAKSGLALPSSKAAYRALLEEQLKAGEGGAALAAKLLQLSPVFAEVSAYAEQAALDTAQAAKDASAALLDSVGISAADMGKTFRDVLAGRTDAQEAGQALAMQVQDGIYNALAGGFADQLTQLMTTQLIQPVIQAAVTGASISEAVSQSAIDSMVAQARAAADALGKIFSDPAFRAAIDSIGTAISGALSAAGSGVKPYSPAAAVSTYTDRGYADASVQPAKDAWRDLIDGIVRQTQDATRELSRLGMTSYESALASIADKAQEQVRSLQDAGYMQAEREARESARSVRDGASTALETLRKSGFAEDSPTIVRLVQRLSLASGEFDRLSEALAKLPPEVQAMVDAETALLKARNALTAKSTLDDLKKEIERLGMTDLEKELASISDRADDYRKGLIDLGQGTAANIAAVKAWEDAMLDAAKNGGGAAASLTQNTDKALAALERAVGVQRDLLQETIGNLQSVFDTLKENARDLYGEVESARQMTAAAGNAFIAQALANAQATGYMPDADALRDAIDGVRQGLAQQQYASNFEAERDRLVLAGKLTDLKDLAEPQLTEAQRQLKVLEETLENARKQIDVLRGIDVSVLSVADAVKALAAAMAAEKAGAAGVKGGGTTTTTTTTGGGGAQSLDDRRNELLNNNVGTWAGDNFKTATQAQIDAVKAGSSGINIFATATSALETLNKAADAELTARGLVSKYLTLGGGSKLNMDDRTDFAYGKISPEDLLKKYGIPGYAVGTNYVPRDGLAYLHEGEAVVPRAYNSAASPGSGGNARLEALVEGLTAEVQRLQGIVARGVEHQRETAEILDNVTEGGNAMRSEVMA